MLTKTHDIYSIREINNGFITSIYEDGVVQISDTSHIDALQRLIVHLQNRLTKLTTEDE